MELFFQQFTNWLSILFILLGSFFTITGSIGLIRMPDFYSRLHPAGLTESFGAPLIIIGLILTSGFTLISLKLMFLIVFLMITSPTATHAITKAAMESGLKPFGTIKEEKPE